MLALRKTKAAPGIDIAEVEKPAIADDEVLVAVTAAGICGSDLHVDDWTDSYRFIGKAVPVTLGHEFSGRVVAGGRAATALAPGTSVVVMPSVTCNACEACRVAAFERCTNRTGIGMTRDGGFARYVAVPERNCIVIPETLEPELAALTEPLTVSQQAVSRAQIGPGSRVVVFGPGSIGQGMAIMARRAGAEHIAVCGYRDKARLATVGKLGFDSVFDLADDADAARLRVLAGRGFDVVLEATGAEAVVRLGLDLLRPGGIFVAGGIHERPAALDVTLMVRRELEIRGSYRSPPATWNEVVAALTAAPGTFAPMITHRLPLEQGIEAFALARRRDGSKIMILP